VIYNQTEVREWHFIINGKPQQKKYTERTIKVAAHRCIGPCVTVSVRKSDIEKDYRKWSDVKSWERTDKDGKKTTDQPTFAGDSFTIEPHWNMLLDLGETPVFDLIEVRGRITFDPDMDVHL